MGHDGPGHIAIAQEQPTLRALKLYHGKRGAGLSVELQVRYGPVTIVGCTQTAEGAAEADRRRGRVDPRRHVPDRQHEQPAALRAAAGRVLRALVRRGPDAPRRARRRPRRRRGAQGRVAAGPRVRRGRLSVERVCFLLRVRPDRLEEYKARHRGGVAGDARRAARDRLGQLLAVPRRRRAAGRLRRDRGLRGGARRHGGDRRQRALAGGDGRVLRAARRASGPTPGCSASRRSSTLPEAPATPRSTSAPPAAASSPAASTAGASTLEEVHRFPNRPVRLPDGLRWNLLHLFTEALEGLRRAGPRRRRRRRHLGRRLRAARRATAACSGCPFHYRDDAHRRDGRARVRPRRRRPSCTRRPASRRCRSTRSSSCSPTRARRRSPPPSGIALVPDLLAYWLCGELANESTNASTTGLLDARSGEWARELIERLGLPAAALRRARRARHARSGRCSPTTSSAPPTVYAVASHDTASAFAAAPVRDEHAAILSSGTWSLLGLELPEPVLTDAAREANLTNERGVDGTTRLLKNVMGMWLLEECRRAWGERRRPTRSCSGCAGPSTATCRCSTPTTTAFLAPGDMPARIAAACERSGQRAAARPRRDRAQHPRLARVQVPLGARAPGGRQRPRACAAST